jgi:hypothetical protein
MMIEHLCLTVDAAKLHSSCFSVLLPGTPSGLAVARARHLIEIATGNGRSCQLLDKVIKRRWLQQHLLFSSLSGWLYVPREDPPNSLSIGVQILHAERQIS